MQAKSLQPLRRGLSLRARIHDRLRAAIISGELAPGSPVIEAELATRLGASRTPVREALRRLEAEGLLEPRGLRGSVVRKLRDCVERMRAAIDDPNEMERHDTSFHDVILASASGERLKRMLTDLREELIAYRLISLSDGARRRATLAEHEAILAALSAHDADAAAERTGAHIANTRAAVLQLAAAAAVPVP
jgi:DNA-binding GntR family transcriptional regulator